MASVKKEHRKKRLRAEPSTNSGSAAAAAVQPAAKVKSEPAAPTDGKTLDQRFVEKVHEATKLVSEMTAIHHLIETADDKTMVEGVAAALSDAFNSLHAATAPAAAASAAAASAAPPAVPDEDMQVEVKTMDGKSVYIHIRASDTIALVKRFVCLAVGHPPREWFTLIFNSTRLADEQRVSDYGIIAGSVMRVIINMRGS